MHYTVDRVISRGAGERCAGVVVSNGYYGTCRGVEKDERASDPAIRSPDLLAASGFFSFTLHRSFSNVSPQCACSALAPRGCGPRGTHRPFRQECAFRGAHGSHGLTNCRTGRTVRRRQLRLGSRGQRHWSRPCWGRQGERNCEVRGQIGVGGAAYAADEAVSRGVASSWKSPRN